MMQIVLNSERFRGFRTVFWLALLFLFFGTAVVVSGEDWPEWRGKGRRGVWNEDGILESFPGQGLKVIWRTPIRSGYSGPAVADGRVFVTDFNRVERNRGFERILCLDERSGEVLWEREWEADYTGLHEIFAIGPRATPTVDGNRVYVLGAMGKLVVLDVESGHILWQKDFVKNYAASIPFWGMAGAPLVDGEKVICLVAGEPDAKVVAFDKHTGKEIWRALSSDWEPGYAQPTIAEIAGQRQLIIWHPRAISSLDPETGEIYWEELFNVTMGMTVSTPVVKGPYLFVSSFYDGARMLRVNEDNAGVTVVWKSTGESEIKTTRIHTLINTAVIQEGYLYGIDAYGQLRCLEAKTGKRLWESLSVTKEKARHAAAHFVRNGDRYFISNDRGELIIARFRPEGYEEVSRTELLKPTSATTARRELGAVSWAHPAYANRHIFARNDEEILKASLAKE